MQRGQKEIIRKKHAPGRMELERYNRVTRAKPQSILAKRNGG